ncbi:AraC-like DNA-binding protein [Herbihabitans rhizosphaerae]|uniref:AraC-like DNA-binding protein n=1 Tax=Herbihabitans rhizosphaerae TaxID=1872711 RepID=A0A4Q7KLK3_9PSEU|nr:AraC family transcriptional regulator [Herbihabitans rhizosphaerae]RZS36431.1 AraC-like DNA-binding protein [Herbihabitans rhizosphaerae]
MDESRSQPVKRLWRPHELSGIEVLHAANVRYSRDDQVVYRGYVVKIAVAGAPAAMRYRGQVVEPAAVGTVTVIEPDELLQSWGTQTTASYQVLFVDADTMSTENGSRPRFPLAHRDDRALWQRLRTFHGGLAAGEDALTAQCSLTGILADMVHRHATGPATGQEPPPPGLRAARDLLHDRLDANLTLDELSDAAGCGKRHLLRAFTDTYGAPPHAYRNMVRLAAAKRMLAGGRTAADAAAEVGFYDQSQLNRHFRRVWGISAGTYARSLR